MQEDMSHKSAVASKQQSRNQENGLVMREQRVEMHSGPLPHPDLLGRYQDIIPDAPERILRMAEKQGDHRVAIEKSLIHANILNERLGLFCGLIVCLVALYCGTTILLGGHELFGFAAIVTALASPLGVYVYVRKEDKKKSR